MSFIKKRQVRLNKYEIVKKSFKRETFFTLINIINLSLDILKLRTLKEDRRVKNVNNKNKKIVTMLMS